MRPRPFPPGSFAFLHLSLLIFLSGFPTCSAGCLQAELHTEGLLVAGFMMFCTELFTCTNTPLHIDLFGFYLLPGRLALDSCRGSFLTEIAGSDVGGVTGS